MSVGIQEYPSGYMAVNRLTGGYLADNTDKRKLVKHVNAKARKGMSVEIQYHSTSGSVDVISRFIVGDR